MASAADRGQLSERPLAPLFFGDASAHDAEQAANLFAAIVESSDDAILTKDLNGIITSWNRAAERLFGYTADEAIGKSITMLIPPDRQDEEPLILTRIRAGERVEHYETVRRRKDGSLVEISLTVSPLKNAESKIIGASKIARDISQRRLAEGQQRLLLMEMDHRVRNLFALFGSLVMLSARSANSAEDLASAIQERLQALARAHALTLSKPRADTLQTEQPTTLHALIATIVSPYDPRSARVVIGGPDIPLSGSLVTAFALLLHEFATNAAKYGALSTPEGRIDIDCSESNGEFVLSWTERGGPRVDQQADGEGFGSLLARTTVKNQLGGEISHIWRPEGLTIRLSAARDRLTGQPTRST
jgi:PAS domain S-box-containing protein